MFEYVKRDKALEEKKQKLSQWLYDLNLFLKEELIFDETKDMIKNTMTDIDQRLKAIYIEEQRMVCLQIQDRLKKLE
jgi:Mg2+/Co2+ transporter CorC